MTAGHIAFEDRSDYDDFVEHVARNRLERDPSDFEYVAGVCIMDLQCLDDTTVTMSFTAEPYVGSEYGHSRLLPAQVLWWRPPAEIATARTMGWREAAVRLLAADLKEATHNIEDE